MATAWTRDARGSLPPLHLVTDDAVLARPGFAEQAEALLRAGGGHTALHLRSRSLGTRSLFWLAGRLVPVARAAGALLLINDRVEVALATAAHGAQIGARGMPLDDARRLLGADCLLGASVHGVAEAERAAANGADFVLAGTLFATPSHPGRAGAGLELVKRLAAGPVPVIGIGGVTPARAAEVRAAGAHGVAVVRGVWNATDPAQALRDYLEALEE